MRIFPRKTLVEQIRATNLHLVSKIRVEADLSYISKKPRTGKQGRPEQYGEKVVVKNLNFEHFKLIENNQGIKAFSGIVYSRSLCMNILLVVEEFQIKEKTILRLLFSTDTDQAPIDLFDMYLIRFQIECGFRDAKRFAGLENSQAKNRNKLNFHFNTALKTVNIAKRMQLHNPNTRENSFSRATYKILVQNALLLSRFFYLFAINPNSIKNHQHVKELLNFGTISA